MVQGRKPKYAVIDGKLTCRTCGKTKPLDGYTLNKTYASGHNSECKACEYARASTKPSGRLSRVTRTYRRRGAKPTDHGIPQTVKVYDRHPVRLCDCGKPIFNLDGVPDFVMDAITQCEECQRPKGATREELKAASVNLGEVAMTMRIAPTEPYMDWGSKSKVRGKVRQSLQNLSSRRSERFSAGSGALPDCLPGCLGGVQANRGVRVG
jgi:hypothetical protein